MTERRNPGCAFGPCNDSAQVGGPGCHLCDDIATLPQRGRGAVLDDPTPVAEGEEDATMTLTADAPSKKAKKVATSKRSSRRGGLPGRLFS